MSSAASGAAWRVWRPNVARQRAIIRISAEELARELGIEGENFRAQYFFEDDCILLALTHPALAWVREGEQARRLSLTEARQLWRVGRD